MKNLVYQSHIGNSISNYPGMEISLNTAFNYANRFNCSYMFNRIMTLKGADTNSLYDRYFNILDLIYDPYFDTYDNILFLDTDVIVHKNADNIFEIPEIRPHTDVIGIPENTSNRYINTGVIVFTKKGRKKAREKWDINWKAWQKIQPKGNPSLLVDQPYMNIMMTRHNFNIIKLGEQWNFWVTEPSYSGFAHFYHFSNDSKKYMSGFKKDIYM